MPNYQNGKIYKIISYQTDDIYIGSTCELLCKRLASHKADFKSWNYGKQKYITSYELLKYEDHQIILIENYPCNSKEELTAREAYHIRNTKCVNKFIPCRTMKEYYEDNKEHLKQYNLEYKEKNKYVIKQYRIQKYICECGRELSIDSKSKHKKSKHHIDHLNKPDEIISTIRNLFI
jgi:hypothetical protein